MSSWSISGNPTNAHVLIIVRILDKGAAVACIKKQTKFQLQNKLPITLLVNFGRKSQGWIKQVNTWCALYYR